MRNEGRIMGRRRATLATNIVANSVIMPRAASGRRAVCTLGGSARGAVASTSPPSPTSSSNIPPPPCEQAPTSAVGLPVRSLTWSPPPSCSFRCARMSECGRGRPLLLSGVSSRRLVRWPQGRVWRQFEEAEAEEHRFGGSAKGRARERRQRRRARNDAAQDETEHSFHYCRHPHHFDHRAEPSQESTINDERCPQPAAARPTTEGTGSTKGGRAQAAWNRTCAW